MKKMMLATAAIVAVSALGLLSSCTQVASFGGNNPDSTGGSNMDSGSYAARARDESITAANAYSDLFLDSNKLESFIQKEKIPDTSAAILRNFYRVRNYQFAWFASDGPTEQARGLWSLYASQKDQTGKDSLRTLREEMDSLLQSDSISVAQNDSSFAHTELTLTQQLVQYASSHPQHINRRNIYYLVPAKKTDAMTYADSILNKQTDSSLYAGNKNYSVLKQQLAGYYNIAKQGGWDSVNKGPLKKGSKSPAVVALKKRLQSSKEYNSTDTTNIFNDSLVTAVKEFQLRNGQKPTGIVTDSMVAVLNVPVEDRIKQILVNMNRILWMPPSNDSTRIEINIPSQMLCVFSDSGKVMEMPVIVGKEGNSTVVFKSGINEIVFNPSWNIPERIVRDELMPKMKADASYLKKHNIEVISDKGSVPELRQMPGKDNPLGKVKFLFPNTHDIYLHDTPDKQLFNKNDRALSHGCIRVADAAKLAGYLLRGQKDWDAQKISAAMKSGREQTVKLNVEQPVSINYFTVYADEKGMVGFRNDVYGHDREAISKLFM